MELTPEQRFAELSTVFNDHPEVSSSANGAPIRMFRSTGQLRVNNKIFAMLVDQQMVMKLPRQRVAQLIADQLASDFRTGQNRIMKEWVTLHPDTHDLWEELANEALTFVRSQAK